MFHRSLLFAALLLAPMAALAQPPSPDTWQVTATPYLMGAGLNGTVGVGPLATEVDASISDVLSHLEFGVMGIVAARKGDWGIGADAIYVGLGATAQRPPADVDFDQTMLAFYALRRLGESAEVTFGARVNGLKGGIALKDGSGRSASKDQWWLDPLVGLNLRTPAKGKLRAGIYAEAGGFGVGSTFAWQLFPTVVVAMSERVSLDLGYRWIGTDYNADNGDRFSLDTVMQGPVIGFAFHF